ncbi:MAG: TIGR03621 family F420-dependent LLM class oxidoreductase, partial [Chloroflexi bacterium]
MPQPFRFTVVTAGAPSHSAWVALARRAEELGYATLVVPDRTITGFAPLTALAVAAEATTSLRIGSRVFCNDYRHPALLAKEVATLDVLSDGRFELGLGAGIGPWDYQQLGMPFEDAGTRVSRLQESLAILKGLFSQESVTFSGQSYTISGMKGLPRPIQKPHPPIVMGCAGKRMLSLAAREANGISLMFRVSPQDRDGPNAQLEQQLAWVREAAGERFAHLELSQLAYNLTITGQRTESPLEEEGPPLPKIP